MSTLFVTIGKITKKGKEKEICTVIGNMTGVSSVDLCELSRISESNKSLLAHLLKEILLNEVNMQPHDCFQEHQNLEHESMEKKTESSLTENVLDVTRLNKNEIQFLLETCINYVETGTA